MRCDLGNNIICDLFLIPIYLSVLLLRGSRALQLSQHKRWKDKKNQTGEESDPVGDFKVDNRVGG